MTPINLPHSLERAVVIQAKRETVFQFFTDNARWSSWWGTGSTIDPRPGGRVYIRHPDGTEAAGEVVDVAAPERLVFTYGFVNGRPIPVGASLVEIELKQRDSETTLHLTHHFAETAARDEHVQGWRYQLSLFANVVADAVHAGVAETVDAWFVAWSEPVTGIREPALSRIAAACVRFRDRFSAIEGLADLLPHVAAIHRFLPGMAIAREGDIRHCQGTVLADWVARSANGRESGRGTNVFVFDPEGRIESVTGFWARANTRA